MSREPSQHRTPGRGRTAGTRTGNSTPPWQIRRIDLDREPVRSIIDRLRHTGKLVLRGGCTENQTTMFTENEGDDNAGHHE
jgi:hypothetical protein